MSSARAHRARLAWATVLAAGLWAGFVANAGWLWASPPQQQPIRERTIEMKLVEFPAPTPAAGATHAQASPAQPSTPPMPQRVVKTPQRPRVHEAVTHPAIRRATPPPAPTPAPRESPPSPTPQPATNATAPAADADASKGPATQTASSGSGTAPAKPLSQPLPDLPDDLRDVAWRTTAVARFTVHADGSVDVELIHPTAMPRLNQILLEALHRWRFAPATENGRPVESRQDVRVHFNVN